MSYKINIKGFNKAKILKVLYDRASVQGVGIFCTRTTELTLEECELLITQNTSIAMPNRTTCYFDYLYGRVMKIDLAEDELRVDLYDRDNGIGAAESAIREVYPESNLIVHTACES